MCFFAHSAEPGVGCTLRPELWDSGKLTTGSYQWAALIRSTFGWPAKGKRVLFSRANCSNVKVNDVVEVLHEHESRTGIVSAVDRGANEISVALQRRLQQVCTDTKPFVKNRGALRLTQRSPRRVLSWRSLESASTTRYSRQS